MTRSDGVEYTAEAVNDTRQQTIALRDAALRQDQFYWATMLTHVIAYLADYADMLRVTQTTVPGMPRVERDRP